MTDKIVFDPKTTPKYKKLRSKVKKFYDQLWIPQNIVFEEKNINGEGKSNTWIDFKISENPSNQISQIDVPVFKKEKQLYRAIKIDVAFNKRQKSKINN